MCSVITNLQVLFLFIPVKNYAQRATCKGKTSMGQKPERCVDVHIHCLHVALEIELHRKLLSDLRRRPGVCRTAGVL